MEITFQSDEVDLLKAVLTNYLSDLRMEIADTEDYDMREEMKRNEATLKSIISRFDKTSAAGA